MTELHNRQWTVVRVLVSCLFLQVLPMWPNWLLSEFHTLFYPFFVGSAIFRTRSCRRFTVAEVSSFQRRAYEWVGYALVTRIFADEPKQVVTLFHFHSIMTTLGSTKSIFRSEGESNSAFRDLIVTPLKCTFITIRSQNWISILFGECSVKIPDVTLIEIGNYETLSARVRFVWQLAFCLLSLQLFQIVEDKDLLKGNVVETLGRKTTNWSTVCLAWSTK